MELTEYERQEIQANRKINAVRSIRARSHGYDLFQAKREIDEWERSCTEEYFFICLQQLAKALGC